MILTVTPCAKQKLQLTKKRSPAAGAFLVGAHPKKSAIVEIVTRETESARFSSSIRDMRYPMSLVCLRRSEGWVLQLTTFLRRFVIR